MTLALSSHTGQHQPGCHRLCVTGAWREQRACPRAGHPHGVLEWSSGSEIRETRFSPAHVRSPVTLEAAVNFPVSRGGFHTMGLVLALNLQMSPFRAVSWRWWE